MSLEWKKIKQEKKDRVLVKTFELPDKSQKELTIYNAGDTVCVFAITNDKKVIVVKQFRPGPEHVMYDLPGGFIDTGEKPEDAAKRELEEETGYTGDLQHIGTTYASAYSNERIFNYVVRNCRKIKKQTLDTNEFIEVQEVHLLEFISLVEKGETSTSITAYAALSYLYLL